MGLFNLGRKPATQSAIALDIGTEFVKCLIFTSQDGDGIVRGVGRARQKLTDMHGGGVTDIHGVAKNCELAISQAAEQAKMLPDQVIVGIAGELVQGNTTTVTRTRTKPNTPIDLSELQEIVSSVQQQAFKKSREVLAEETGLDEIDVQLVNSAVVSVSIDGYKITNPLSYQGKEMSVGVYSAFAPIVQLGALETIVQELGLKLIAVSAEPYAVSRCLNEATSDFSGIFIDIGGGTTDVAVVRNGGVEGTKMYAIGGRAFTKRVASALGVNFAEAEQAKLDYSAGKLEPDQAKLVAAAFKTDVGVWRSGLELTLEEFGHGDLLPSRILLCGGGSNLPEIKSSLEEKDWSADLSFARQPEVRFIKPGDIDNFHDETGKLTDISDVTPMALANVALELIGETTVLEKMMRKTIAGLKQ